MTIKQLVLYYAVCKNLSVHFGTRNNRFSTPCIRNCVTPKIGPGKSDEWGRRAVAIRDGGLGALPPTFRLSADLQYISSA